MATTYTLVTIREGSDDDPFRFGWRHVRHEQPDGTETWERVPLTLEDVLHPQEEDFIVQNAAHARRQRYIADVFSIRLADDPTAVVLADVRVAWDVPGITAHGPDIAVILGVKQIRDWGTFDVAEEGVRPILIVELTSPSTASLDRSNKLEEYDLVGVETYIIVDSVTRGGVTTLRLLGYTLTPAGYRVLPPNERGWLWLDVVRVWLGITDNEVVCYDEAGQPLGDYVAVSEALRAETRARALAEHQVRAEAEARVLAEQQAEAEATARALAEERLRQLEAELARLRAEK
jgi:Uma2 family endonuclease